MGMEKPLSRLLQLCTISISVLAMMPICVGGSPQFPAIFVFGDSLMDDGNNNYLNSLAKANYLPYGIDFFEGPNGRFCNGKTIIDFLGNCTVCLILFISVFVSSREIIACIQILLQENYWVFPIFHPM